jgi:lysophospholipase L1-like esterase
METALCSGRNIKNCLLLLAALAGLLGMAVGCVCHCPSPQARPTLVLVGDSTVHNNSRGQQGWGEPLAALFDSVRINVTNCAMGGRSSRSFQTEGRWDKALELLHPGDFVLIQFGHNDGGSLDDGRDRTSLKGIGDETRVVTNKVGGKVETVHTYGWYLRKYIADARARGATPILCTLVPRKIWKDGKVVRATETYARWAREVAKAEKVELIDLNELVAVRYEALGEAKVNSLFGDEHTHTNPEGAQLNSQCVAEGVKQLKRCHLKHYLLK